MTHRAICPQAKPMPTKIAILVLVLFLSAHVSNALADTYRLFSDDDTLRLVIEAPINSLRKEAQERPEVAGQLHYSDDDGKEVTLDIELTTRGKSRLSYCQFPPLSIKFKSKQTASTLFAGQKKLKIGTHCKKGTKYDDYLEQEFGIYKAFRLLTPYSFRVRKLEITYRDNEKKRKDEIYPAFFIESIDEVADRLGMKEIKTPSINVRQLDAEQTSISGLFQYLVANTDWDVTRGPGGEDCCHNGKVLGQPGANEDWVVVPYDFDQSGLINTEYAMPIPALGIRSVRQRLYRGECLNNSLLPQTIALFNEQRDALETALVPETLSPSTRKSALKYIREFYETINDADKLNKKIIADCQKG
jgi:hypothetical protein